MLALGVIVGVLVLLVALVLTVNGRHEQARTVEGPPGAAEVEALWEVFSGADETGMRAEVEALLERVSVAKIRDKGALVRLAVMCARTGLTDALPELAAQASEVALGCGETASLVALSEVWNGDPKEALAALQAARQGGKGCSSCGASLEVKMLEQELSIAVDSRMGSAAPSPEPEPAPEGMLRVRRVAMPEDA